MIDGDGGSITKVGAAKLILAHANLYTGGTTIKAGELRIANADGSATGTGAVQLDNGILSGTGRMDGALSIGAGSASHAFLSPGSPSATGTLRIRNTVTFNSDGTYDFRLNSNSLKADKVIANGVTLISGAFLAVADVGAATLAPGTTLTAISNNRICPFPASSVISPNGSTTTVGSNTFQASYTGGDGNDLTLTVVP